MDTPSPTVDESPTRPPPRLPTPRRKPTEIEAIALRAAALGDDQLLRVLQVKARDAGACAHLQTHTGLPCERRPHLGHLVCPAHGGRSQGGKAKAERLLAVARLPGIEALLSILDQYSDETCETCGYPNHSVDEKRLIERVARTVFDRTGLGPGATLHVKTEAERSTLDMSVMSPGELAELDVLLASMDGLKRRVRDRLEAEASVLLPDRSLGQVTEGEVIRDSGIPNVAPAPGGQNLGLVATDARDRPSGGE